MLSARSFDMDTSLLDSCGQSAHREDDRPAGAPQRPRLPPGGASRRQAVNLKALCIMLRERSLRAAMGQEEPSSRARAPISPIEAAGTPNLAAHYQSDAALSRALTHSTRVQATPASPPSGNRAKADSKGARRHRKHDGPLVWGAREPETVRRANCPWHDSLHHEHHSLAETLGDDR